MNSPLNSAEQLRDEMRKLRSHMDADVDDFVENTRGLLDWHSYYESAPWLFLGAAAFAGYMLVPSKVRHVTIDLDKLADLAKHRQVVVKQAGSANGSADSGLSKMVMGLVWRTALAVASQQLNRYFSSRPQSGTSPDSGRPSPGR
jgi:hypothetical protein